MFKTDTSELECIIVILRKRKYSDDGMKNTEFTRTYIQNQDSYMRRNPPSKSGQNSLSQKSRSAHKQVSGLKLDREEPEDPKFHWSFQTREIKRGFS